jgi:DNA invertase Pin-like site-specific DNA recombinase
VSTQKQVDSGLGLASQERQLREKCEERGWCLEEVLSDKGRSAKNMSRDGIGRAMELLQTGKADVLMVSKSDRATRSVRDLYDLMDASARDGWVLVDLETEVDTSDPTGRMIAGMRGVVSQWEREIIGKRTREALAEKRAQGLRLGRPRVVTEASVQRVKDLKAAGLTVRAIADALNTERVPTASGGRWHVTTVQRLLTTRDRT